MVHSHLTGGVRRLEALGPNGSYWPSKHVDITDVSGNPVAKLSLVPRVFVTRAISALRAARPLPPRERIYALRDAGRLFSRDVLAGATVEQYQRDVARVAGIPISEVRAACDVISRSADTAYDVALLGRPVGAVNSPQESVIGMGGGVWCRRGDVLAVHAPGNHPAVHSLWLQALALGYRVAVRPSSKDPFTPLRLVSALRAAGFGNSHVCLLPTDHDGADEMIRAADRTVVYGNDAVIARYASSTKVLGQGPGRSKILITADTDWRDHLDTIAESVSHGGGTACVNATAVMVEGDPSELAGALADRLSILPNLPPEDDHAVLPVRSVTAAREIDRQLQMIATGTRRLLGAASICHELGDGSAVLRPAVQQVDDAQAAQVGVELGFPCVWVAPWTRADRIVALKQSLVVTVLTRDMELVDDLLAEPTISNVNVGDIPTFHAHPRLPHDSYLSDFLMRTKTFIRA